MQISGSFAKLLIDFMALYHIDLPHEKWQKDLCDESTTVSENEYTSLLEYFHVQMNEDNELGLKYGSYLSLQALGIIHQISLHTSSLHQAIDLLAQYLGPNFSLLDIQLENTGHSYHMQLSSKTAGIVNTLILESSLLLIAREIQLMLSSTDFHLQVPKERITFISTYCEYQVMVGEANYKLIIPDGGDLQLNKNTLKQIGHLLPKFLMLLENPIGKETKSFSMQVWKMTLQMCNPYLPTLNQVAEQFAMSERSFQRKLQNEQTTFRQVSNTIKHRLSGLLKNDDQLKTQEIAYLLGYTDSSAYLHAARTWSA